MFITDATAAHTATFSSDSALACATAPWWTARPLSRSTPATVAAAVLHWSTGGACACVLCAVAGVICSRRLLFVLGTQLVEPEACVSLRAHGADAGRWRRCWVGIGGVERYRMRPWLAGSSKDGGSDVARRVPAELARRCALGVRPAPEDKAVMEVATGCCRRNTGLSTAGLTSADQLCDVLCRTRVRDAFVSRI